MTYPSKRQTKPKSESDIQADILGKLNLIKGSYWVKTIKTNRSGTPDIIGWYNGKSYAIELKKPGEEPDLLQAITLEDIQAAGGDSVITASCVSIQEIAKLIGL